MSVQSLAFLAFLTVTVCVCRLLPKERIWVLLAASLVFYLWDGAPAALWGCGLLAVSSFASYLAANTLRKHRRKSRYLLGRETNGLMNYPFRTALMAFLLGGGAEYFRDSMEQLRENYPAPAFYGAMNFLSTHDTPRLLTILGLSTPAPQTRDERAVYRLSEEELAHGKALLKLASLILYTFPGSPMLYYGDEAGMQGFEDPFNRGTYPWGHEDEELLRCFRQLGALRRAHEALQSGTIVYHAAQGRVLAFSRRAAHDHCLTVVNAGEEVVTLTLPWDAALAEDALSHQSFFCGDGMLRLTLEPYGAMLLTEPQD